MLRGGLPYRDFYFPYPPVFVYVISAIGFLNGGVDAFRIFAVLCDVGILICVWKTMQNRFDNQNIRIVLLAYALLPMSVIESGWIGHFEPLTNLFMLVSIYFFLCSL